MCIAQVFIVELTSFLIFTNELPDATSILMTELCTLVLTEKIDELDKVKLAAHLETDIQSVVNWYNKWLVNSNTLKICF